MLGRVGKWVGNVTSVQKTCLVFFLQLIILKVSDYKISIFIGDQNFPQIPLLHNL